MTKIGTLSEVAEALSSLGYGIRQHQEALSINVGHDVVATAMIEPERNELVINCLVAKLGEIIKEDGDQAVAALVGLLDANSATRPFAFSVEPGDEHEAAEYPVVLTNSVSLGDFSQEELKTLMDSLNRALAIAHSIISSVKV